jgi:adenosine deaminase
VRIVDDLVVWDGQIVDFGPTARRVIDGGIPLEMCPYSNIHTRAVLCTADHPAGMLHRAGFTVTLNTDNRLMSNTTMTKEFRLATDLLGFSENDLRAVTLNAVEAAFCDEETRNTIRDRVLAGYDGG